MSLTTTHPNSLDGRFESVTLTEWSRNLSQEFGAFVSQRMTSRPTIRRGETIAGMATAPVKGESANIQRFRTQAGNDVLETVKTYAMGFRLSQEMREDDLFDHADELFRLNGAILANTVITDVFNRINTAFSANISYHGAAAISTSHTLAGGGTGTNRPASDAVLSETMVETLVQLLTETVNEDGVNMRLRPQTLLYSTADWATGGKIINSTTTTLAATGESGNAVSMVNALGLTPFATPLLTSTDDVFLFAQQSPLTLAWKRSITQHPGFEDLVANRDWVYDVDARWVSFWDGWRKVAGTSGAA